MKHFIIRFSWWILQRKNPEKFLCNKFCPFCKHYIQCVTELDR